MRLPASVYLAAERVGVSNRFYYQAPFTTLQETINAASAANGGVVVLPAGIIDLPATAVVVPRDVTFEGTSVPGVDPSDPPLGTRLRRISNNVAFSLVGTNRSTDRVGRNLFRDIQFLDSTNISASPFFDCKYADSVVFENCTFWQPDNQTTCGDFIYAEECWDWRLWNVCFKHYGNASKAAIRLFNGTVDNTNGFKFYACRWQEGVGIALDFDSSGVGGSANHDFEFFGCKWEDTGNAAKTFINGDVRDLHVFGGQIAGCGERKVSQPSAATRWRFTDVTFANGGDTPTEMIELLGNRSSIKGCTFQGPGTAVVQYINVTGADNEVTGCSRASTTLPLVNTSGVNATTKIHHNTDFLTEYSSTAQITSGNTTVVVTHGMGYTPVNHHIQVTAHSSMGAATTFWVSTITSTQFTINVNVDPAATVTFAWQIQRTRG